MYCLFKKRCKGTPFYPYGKIKMHKNDHFVRKQHDLCNKKHAKRPAPHPPVNQMRSVQGACFLHILWLHNGKPQTVSVFENALRILPLRVLVRDRFSRDISVFRFFPSFCWDLWRSRWN